MKSFFCEIINSLLDTIFPRYCPGCYKRLYLNEKYLCLYCKSQLPKTNYHINKNNPLLDLFIQHHNIQQVSAFLFFQSNSIVQNIIHNIKYKDMHFVAQYLARMYASDIINSNYSYKNIDIIVPIPLHKKKLKQRGYNQSYYIALGISEILNIPIEENIITRIKNTESQTNKNIEQRIKNMEKAFALNENAINYIQNKHILIIDDVITTGSTINSIIQILPPTTKISVMALAYAIN